MSRHVLCGVCALLSVTSFALAGGGEKGEKERANARRMEALARAPQESAELKAKAGSGFTITAGEDYSLTMSNRVMVRWRFSNMDAAPDTNNFRIRRLRTKLKGHVFSEALRYQLQFDWTRAAPILDAWARWAFWNDEESSSELAFRVGAGKTFFGREETGSSSSLEHVERSVVANRFSGNSRQIGAVLMGSHGEGGKFHWRAGVFNGDPGRSNSVEGAAGQNVANAAGDNEVDFVFAARVDPMGDMGDEGYKQGDLDHSEELKASVGAALLIGNHRTSAAQAPANADVETWSANVNGAVKIMGVHAIGEIFFRNDDVKGGADGDSFGWFVSGSYTMKPSDSGRQYALAARVGQILNNDAIPAGGLNASNSLGQAKGDLTEISLTADAYFHKHKLKTQIGWTFHMVDFDAAGASDLDNHFFDVLFQWVF